MNGTNVDEVELVSKAQAGDRGAFSELVRRNYAGVLSVVYRMTGNTDLAEDAAQETFIQAWLHLPGYKHRSSLRNWLYRIAVNAALDALRKERRLSADELDELPLSDPQPGPEAALVAQERVTLVQQAIISLPPASRAVLVLREYEELSYQEIAAALDIPLGTVMSRLNYARTQLRARLEAQLVFAEEQNG